MDYSYLKKWVEQSKEHLSSNPVVDIKLWRDIVAIYFRGRDKYLILSLDSKTPLIFFTDNKSLPFVKSSKIDIFLQHLKHSQLTSLKISDSDRIMTLEFSKTDIYNQKIQYQLIFEMIPRQTNLILTKEEKGEFLSILDCWRAVTLAGKTSRQVLPGTKYSEPSQDGYTLRSKTVQLPISVCDFIPESTSDFSSSDLNCLFSHLLLEIILPTEGQKRKEGFLKKISKQIEKKEKKISKLKQELVESSLYEEYKKRGELLKGNLNSIKRGMSQVTVTDYYSLDAEKITIQLLDDLTPYENMQLLFKKYRKGVTGRQKIEEQIVKAQEEVDSLQGEIFDLEEGDPLDFLLIKEEKSKKKSEQEKRKQRFKKIEINSDWEVFIGRTSRENDELTCRMSKPTDWWFHSRIFQGAHIILRNYQKKEPSSDLITLCARIAAYYSKAKNSTNIPVDYTQIRYVTKPHGSPAGYVIYKNQKTLFVNPLSIREAVNQLEKFKV